LTTTLTKQKQKMTVEEDDSCRLEKSSGNNSSDSDSVAANNVNTDNTNTNTTSTTTKINLSSKIKNITDKFIEEELLTDSEKNTQTKKDYFLQIATQFLEEGTPKEKISTFTLIAIEERLYQKLSKEGIPRERCKLSTSSIRHFRRVMGAAGFTDPFYARNKKDHGVGEGAEQRQQQKKTKQKTEFQIENKMLIELFTMQKEIIHDIIAWLCKNSCTTKLNEKKQCSVLLLGSLIQDLMVNSWTIRIVE